MNDTLLTEAELAATAGWIASLQVANGMIPWFPGGHADPWNHTEAAMALVVAGRVAEAEAAYAWLASTQLPDGSWCLPTGSWRPGGSATRSLTAPGRSRSRTVGPWTGTTRCCRGW